MNGIDESGNPGADFDGLQWGEAAGIFVPFGDALLQRVRDGDGRRGRRISSRLAVAAGQRVGEQQQSNQRHNAVHGVHFSSTLRSGAAKKPCSAATTCAPSPTEAATRLTEPERTSPMAKIPGRLVSSKRRLPPASVPVSTNPLASSATPA